MLEKILKIDNNERTLFKQHFLKGVILAITFSQDIKEFFADNTFTDFFASKGFSDLTEIKNSSFKITIDNDIPVAEQTNATIGYTYTNIHNNNQIQIISNRFIFIHNTYSNYEKLNNEIEMFNENIFSKINADINQVGFRKINAIVVRDVSDYRNITDLFNDNLFNFMKCDLFDINNLENYRDNFTLSKNNSKIIVNTSCAKIQNIENSYEIVIDTDIIQNEIDNAMFINVIKDINHLHYNTFCWFTSEKMKKIMNGVL